MLNHHTKAIQPQRHLPVTPNLVIWLLVISLVLMLIPPTVSVLQTVRTAVSSVSTISAADRTAALLRSENPDEREQAIQQLAQAARAGSPEAVGQLAAAFQRDEFLAADALSTAHALASIGSRPAYQALIQGFQQNQPSTRRYAAMAVLEKASPTVAPLLIAALRDSDAGVRSSSAELLGFRRELLAADALSAATYDAEPRVREASAWALGGELAVWHSLRRMQLLQSTDPDAQVRAAAVLAADRIRSNIARALGIAPADLLLVSVATANGLIYAATPDGLYAIRDSSNWRLFGVLPDYPTALAAGGPDGQVVYLGTISSGPFRSLDGGQTWERILVGLPTAERLMVTSLVITATEAEDRQQLTMSLAVIIGTTELHMTPLGIFRSEDGGTTWLLMDEA